jgi:hypothetical protein
VLYREENDMFEWQQIPLKSIYREVIDFHLKENSDNYIQAGWYPVSLVIEVVQFIQTKQATHLYRVGWLRGAGEPVHPPILDEGRPPRVQDLGPSES